MTGTDRTNSKPQLRLRVTAAAESQLRAGHPWVFSDSVREANRAGEAGELAVVFDRKDKFWRWASLIRIHRFGVRVLHAGQAGED